MAIRASHSSPLGRPLKSSFTTASTATTGKGSSTVPIVYLVLLLVTLVATAGPLQVVSGMSTQQQQQQQQRQQQEKYAQNSAAEQSLAEQMILAEPPQLQVGKPSPYDLVSELVIFRFVRFGLDLIIWVAVLLGTGRK